MLAYDNGAWVPIDYNKVIKVNPDNSEKLRCSRCGEMFVSKGIRDYMFAYISHGCPVYVPRPDVVCYECDKEVKRDRAKGTFVGGPLG